jgi:hypothetical protein
MFAGASREFRRGERPSGGIIGRAFDTAAREQAGPQRIESPEAAGRRIAEEVMQAQLQEAEQNEIEDNDACQEAWNARPSNGRRGDRQEFLSLCRALPESQQRCLSPSYLQQHIDECAAIHEREGRQFAEDIGFDPDRPGAIRRP